MSTSESTSGVTSFVGFTSPQHSGRIISDIQMTSNRSYRDQTQGNPSWSIHGDIDLEREVPVEQTHGDVDYEAKKDHLLRHLGMCNDPYCTTCPTSYKRRNVPYGDAKGWAGKKLSLLKQYMFGIRNPHVKEVQWWNRFFVISCLVAIFIDPLFFYVVSVKKDRACIVLNMPMTITFVVLRSMTDLIYFMHMLVQFRLAFVSPESKDVITEELVDDPKKIAKHYLSGFFFLDFVIMLPLPQIIVMLVLPDVLVTSGANYAKNILRSAILFQYFPRLYRFLPLLAGQSPNGFIFESAWVNFFINLLTFVLAGHVVGSFWYLFGLQRVNQCLQDACLSSTINNCMKLMDCGNGIDYTISDWDTWGQNENATACFKEDGFSYGIYVKAVNLTTESAIKRYVYSFFWGFQQISTLAGNQVPSYFVWEVLFTMGITGLGLLLFALLIGNMQNFLLGLGRRRLEMSLRRRDVEQWMSHRRLPHDLKKKVRESGRYNWAATHGVNEEMLMENMPEDLQRDIRRHLFQFVKKHFNLKVQNFELMGEPILDAIYERLRQKIYIKGGKTLYRGRLVTKMVFIFRGKMKSKGEDGNKVLLKEGDVCGEELLTWCLEHSSVNGDIANHKKQRYLLSNRTVECLTNVEAYVLRAADLEEVTSLFAGFLRNHPVQTAIRNESPRGRAATCIQVAWRFYRKKRLNRAET